MIVMVLVILWRYIIYDNKYFEHFPTFFLPNVTMKCLGMILCLKFWFWKFVRVGGLSIIRNQLAWLRKKKDQFLKWPWLYFHHFVQYIKSSIDDNKIKILINTESIEHALPPALLNNIQPIVYSSFEELVSTFFSVCKIAFVFNKE